MDWNHLATWTISAVICAVVFLIIGYFLRKIKFKFLPIFLIVEFLLAFGIAYGFMMVFSSTPSLIVASQPYFLASFFISSFTGIVWVVWKFSKSTFLCNMKNILYQKAYILTVVIGVGLLAYGFINVQNVQQVNYDVKSDKLQGEYNIVFLSDVHYGGCQLDSALENAVEEISQLNPDYLIIGGDLIDDFTSKSQMENVVNIFSKAEVKKEMIFINGNHELLSSTKIKNEIESFTSDDLANNLKKAGFVVLNNEALQVSKDLTFIAKDEFASGSDDDFFNTHLKDNKFSLCLDHEPDTWDKNCNFGIDLQVSGHNHYGQLFPIGFVSKFIGYYIYGPYYQSNSELIVSSGFGAWEYPIRTANHCEYIHILLSPKN